VTVAMSEQASSCVVCGDGEARPVLVKDGWPLVRCVGCDLVSVRPLPDADELERHHEQSYRDGAYARFAAAERVRETVARHRLALVRPLAPTGPWLDVGCSTGAFLAEAAAAGIEAEGVELAAPAVAAARTRGLRVHHLRAEDFRPERRYAMVTAFDVIEHLRDPGALATRARAWLAPEGVLVLTLPDLASLPARVLGRHWFYCAPPDHLHYFTPATIRRLLAGHGFADMTIRPLRKPLTLEYAGEQLGRQVPRLGAAVDLLAAAVPARWRGRPWLLPLGEMLVAARPRADR